MAAKNPHGLGPCFDCEKTDPDTCTHPPTSLYSWMADDPGGPVTVVICLGCNTILQGAAEELEV